MITKTDQRNAERLLNKTVSIARARAVLAKTDEDRLRVYVDNTFRFETAILAAAQMVEEI